eukprot:gene12635-13932_t
MATKRFLALIITLLFQICLHGMVDSKKSQFETSESRLFDELFKTRDYDNNVRPVRNKSLPVQVSLDVALEQLIDLNDREQNLQTSLWIRQKWVNELLTWDPKEYSGIKRLTVDKRHLWTPDIVLYNNAKDGKHAGSIDQFKTRISIRYNGTQEWFIPAILTSSCSIDITYFPFDVQKCKLKFGSWTYLSHELNLTKQRETLDLSAYSPSSSFHLRKAPAIRNVIKYDCCDNPYIDITFQLHLQRESGYYFYNVIIPVMVVTIFTLMNFLLPDVTGSRMGLIMDCFLAITVTYMMVGDKMPVNSDSVPIIAKFILFCMCTMVANVIASAISMRLRIDRPMSNTLRSIVFGILAPLVFVKPQDHSCMPCKTFCAQKKKKKSTENKKPDRRVDNEREMEMFALFSRNSSSSGYQDTTDGSLGGGEWEKHFSSGFSSLDSTKAITSKSDEECLRNMYSLLEEQNRKIEDINKKDFWRCVSQIADRIFLAKIILEEEYQMSKEVPWQSGYFVLKRSTAYSGLLLDEYRDASLKLAKQTLFLDNIKHVGLVNTSKSQKFAFQVVVLGRSPLLFACDNEMLRSEWISVFSKFADEETGPSSVLCRISPDGGPSGASFSSRSKAIYNHGDDLEEKCNDVSVYGFEVAVLNTPLSVANNLQGKYLLQISKSRIFLKLPEKKEEVLSWPLTQLRGFKSQPDQQLIVLETGRGCHFGRGRLTFNTKYYVSIIQEIREAVCWQDEKKAFLEISSGSSSDSDSEITHRVATRCKSEQKCNVTVSLRPRRTHSERVFNQVALGASPIHQPVSKSSCINPASFVNANNSCLKVPPSCMDDANEEVFTAEDKASLQLESNKVTQGMWKTSPAFSKTMVESKSDNEYSSNENNATDDMDGHPYLDIIADKENEKPLTSDEATTLLAQVVADLTEPQKKSYFVKSNSTGGIQSRRVDANNEIRRASAPTVGIPDFNVSLDSENQDAINNGSRKFKLEKINEVSFSEQPEAEKPSGQKMQEKSQTFTQDKIGTSTSDHVERPRSKSDMLLSSTQQYSPVMDNFKKTRSKSILTTTCVGSSLTDLRNKGVVQQHHELRSVLSHSSMSSLAQQLARDPLSNGFKSGSGKIPNFPKRSVVKAVESVGGVDSSRTKFSMSPLPKDFHILEGTESIDEVPPRPPKDNETKSWKKQSTIQGQHTPPPIPDRLLSSIGPIQLCQERITGSMVHCSKDHSSRMYANTPPKVQPRTPNAQPLQSSMLSCSNELVTPPPRPPKPESSTRKSNKVSLPLSAKQRRSPKEKRCDSYTWDVDYNSSHEITKDASPQLGFMKNPIVTITPPRSPVMPGSLKHGQLRGMSFSTSDITSVFKKQSEIKNISLESQNIP